MAAELVVPVSSAAKSEFAVSGTGFQAETPVEITLAQRDMKITVVSDINGDFDLASVLVWKPKNIGLVTVVADDGTDVVTADVVINST